MQSENASPLHVSGSRSQGDLPASVGATRVGDGGVNVFGPSAIVNTEAGKQLGSPMASPSAMVTADTIAAHNTEVSLPVDAT